MIIDVNGSDTFKIQRFDNNGKLVFLKSSPPYGATFIVTYAYDNNQLTNYTSLDSRTGFQIEDYVYDKAKNTKTTYYFESKNKKNDNSYENLNTYQTDNTLKELKSYKSVHQDKNKVLKQIAFYRDTLIIKEVQFSPNGDTSEITTYGYENNSLKNKRLIMKNSDYYNDLIYSYDKNGNEIEWVKIFKGVDTASSYKKVYDNNLLVEEREFYNRELQGVTKYEYADGLLKFKKNYDLSDNLRKQEEYYYNKNKTLNKIIIGRLNVFYIYE